MFKTWFSQARLTFKEYIGLHILTGLFISFVCLWAFSEIADQVFINESIINLDHLIANALHEGATTLATQVFLIVTAFGEPVIWGVGFAVGFYFLYKRWRFRLALWVIALAGGNALNTALKLWFARPRPVFDNPLARALLPSFPSGHAMMSLIMYGLLAYFLVTNTRSRPRKLLIITAAALLILLVGFSRLYLGVHYLSDIIAGFAAGGVWLSTCITALNFIRQRRLALQTGDGDTAQLEDQDTDNRHT
jgi:membrane-associated phospholipid phosphatase